MLIGIFYTKLVRKSEEYSDYFCGSKKHFLFQRFQAESSDPHIRVNNNHIIYIVTLPDDIMMVYDVILGDDVMMVYDVMLVDGILELFSRQSCKKSKHQQLARKPVLLKKFAPGPVLRIERSKGPDSKVQG